MEVRRFWGRCGCSLRVSWSRCCCGCVPGELWGGAGCRRACGSPALGRMVVRFGAMFRRQTENQPIAVDQRSGPQFVNKRRIESLEGVGEFFSSNIRLYLSCNSPSDASSSANHATPALGQCSRMREFTVMMPPLDGGLGRIRRPPFFLLTTRLRPQTAQSAT